MACLAAVMPPLPAQLLGSRDACAVVTMRPGVPNSLGDMSSVHWPSTHSKLEGPGANSVAVTVVGFVDGMKRSKVQQQCSLDLLQHMQELG
jgi:hypothetical protein